MAGPEFTRRNLLKATAGAALAMSGSGEALAAPRLLDVEKKRVVEKLVTEALEKTDDVGHVLFSDIQGGALLKNFREFVILQRVGPQYSKFRGDRALLNDRDKRILVDNRFLEELKNDLKQKGLITDEDVIESPPEAIACKVMYEDEIDSGRGQGMSFKYFIGINNKEFGDKELPRWGN